MAPLRAGYRLMRKVRSKVSSWPHDFSATDDDDRVGKWGASSATVRVFRDRAGSQWQELSAFPNLVWKLRSALPTWSERGVGFQRLIVEAASSGTVGVMIPAGSNREAAQ